MAIWNKLFKPKAQTTQEPISITDSRLLEILGIELDEINLKGKNALKEATVYACIRILADAVGKLPVKIYQDKDGKQAAADHYLTPILKTRPNPWMTSRDFFKALEVQRNVYGNAYAWIDVETSGRNAGQVTGVYPLDSSRVEIWIDDVGLLPGQGKMWYVYRDNKGKEYKIRPDEILHIKNLTFDGIVGMTPLEQLKETVENAGAASKFLNNSFKSGMQTKGIIHYVGD